jgi:hypothetical protein
MHNALKHLRAGSRGVLLAAVASWACPADAQEITFRIDTVLVAAPSHLQSLPKARAAEVHAAVAKAVARRHLTVTMEEVRPFENYDATIYLESCPPGRYDGCSWVIGQRAGADWVVGFELVAQPDGALLAEVHYIDVAENQLLHVARATFGAVGSVQDTIVAGQLAEVLDQVIAGEYAVFDLRGDVEAAAAAEAEAARFEAQRIETEGLELADFERDLGELERNEAVADVARVRARDLTWDGREDASPWERVGLSRSQYARFKNTRASLPDFRSRARGRQGELLIGTGLGVGVGPFEQAWEGWYGLDAADLSVVERATSLELRRGDVDPTWHGELGVGVLPWLDVTGFAGVRPSEWWWRVQQVVEGEDVVLREPSRKVVSGWFAGGRVSFAPLPTYPARPTLGVGAMAWTGPRPERVVAAPQQLAVLERSWMALVQLTPGVEVNLGSHLALWGRASVEIPVAGRVAQLDSNAGAVLTDWTDPSAQGDGVGVSGQIGLTARVRFPAPTGRKPGR